MSLFRKIVFVSACGGAWVVVVGCIDDTIYPKMIPQAESGTNSEDSSQPMLGPCEPRDPNEPCQQCIANTCCAQLTACADDRPGCWDFYQCMLVNNDFSRCLTEAPQTNVLGAKLPAIDTCRKSMCSSMCAAD